MARKATFRVTLPTKTYAVMGCTSPEPASLTCASGDTDKKIVLEQGAFLKLKGPVTVTIQRPGKRKGVGISFFCAAESHASVADVVDLTLDDDDEAEAGPKGNSPQKAKRARAT